MLLGWAKVQRAHRIIRVRTCLVSTMRLCQAPRLQKQSSGRCEKQENHRANSIALLRPTGLSLQQNPASHKIDVYSFREFLKKPASFHFPLGIEETHIGIIVTEPDFFGPGLEIQ